MDETPWSTDELTSASDKRQPRLTEGDLRVRGVAVAERGLTRRELEVLRVFRRRPFLRRPPRGPYMNAKPSLMFLLYFHTAQQKREILGNA